MTKTNHWTETSLEEALKGRVTDLRFYGREVIFGKNGDWTNRYAYMDCLTPEKELDNPKLIHRDDHIINGGKEMLLEPLRNKMQHFEECKEFIPISGAMYSADSDSDPYVQDENGIKIRAYWYKKLKKEGFSLHRIKNNESWKAFLIMKNEKKHGLLVYAV